MNATYRPPKQINEQILWLTNRDEIYWEKGQACGHIGKFNGVTIVVNCDGKHNGIMIDGELLPDFTEEMLIEICWAIGRYYIRQPLTRAAKALFKQ